MKILVLVGKAYTVKYIVNKGKYDMRNKFSSLLFFFSPQKLNF